MSIILSSKDNADKRYSTPKNTHVRQRHKLAATSYAIQPWRVLPNVSGLLHRRLYVPHEVPGTVQR